MSDKMDNATRVRLITWFTEWILSVPDGVVWKLDASRGTNKVLSRDGTMEVHELNGTWTVHIEIGGGTTDRDLDGNVVTRGA